MSFESWDTVQARLADLRKAGIDVPRSSAASGARARPVDDRLDLGLGGRLRERLREVARARMAVAAVDSGGSSSAQISCAFQQRVRKRQPDGGFAGLGTSPSSTIRERWPRWFGDSIGTAERSACV